MKQAQENDLTKEFQMRHYQVRNARDTTGKKCGIKWHDSDRGTRKISHKKHQEHVRILNYSEDTIYIQARAEGVDFYYRVDRGFFVVIPYPDTVGEVDYTIDLVGRNTPNSDGQEIDPGHSFITLTMTKSNNG